MPKRILKGIVTSDKAAKTVTVKVEDKILHPVYKKYIKRSKKYLAHDAEDQYKTGDFVSIEEHRPLSKNKNWVVIGKVD